MDDDETREQARDQGDEADLARAAKALKAEVREAKAQLRAEVREAKARAAAQAREVAAQALEQVRNATDQATGQAAGQLQDARAQLREAQERTREQRAREREQRERDRERKIAEHLSRDRERGRFTQPPKQGRGLRREDIVDAAIAIADAEGTEAVSMRRIARELGAGAMSLYWHVSSKEELQMAMLEAIPPELPEPSGSWRDDLAAFARAAREGLMRHPWAIDFLVSGPPAGPRNAGNAEWLLAALDSLGLGLETMSWVGSTVATYVAGAVIREAQEVRWHRETQQLLAAMTAEEAEQWRARHLGHLTDPGRFPHMARIHAEGIDPDAPETRDERFEFGLDTLLDGIAARFSLG